MNTNKNTVLIILGVLVLILFVWNANTETKKEAGPGGATITRTISPASTAPSGEFTIKYTISSATGNYGGILTEVIPTGFTINPTSFINNMDVFSKKITGQLIEMPFAGSANGQYIEYKLTAGSTSGTLSQGKVDWGSGAGTDVLPSASLTICVTQSSYSCSSGNVMWFNSCGVMEGIKESCTPTPCSGFGVNTCDSLTIKHSRTCYTSGCSVNACTQTPSTQTEIVTSAPNSNNGVCAWQCSAGACQQNTPADNNYDGGVNNQELLNYISLWISNTVSNTQLLSAITVWIG